MDFLEILKTRRSVRRYNEKPIPKNIIEDIIDCGRLAPSARNLQPCRFVVISDRCLLERIADFTDNGKFISKAAACVAIFCDTKATRLIEDGSAATENIIIGAWAYGIGSCWVAGYNKHYAPDIRKLLEVPEEYQLISLVSLGYPADKIFMPPVKKSLNEVLHWNKY